MTPEAKKLCEEIDAALFSSDTFHTKENIDEFREYLRRWRLQINEIDITCIQAGLNRIKNERSTNK